MCFKIVKLTVVRNVSRRTISTSGGLESLQVVSGPVIGRCKTRVRVGLNPLYSRHVLKLWCWRRYVNGIKRTISTSVGLELLQNGIRPSHRTMVKVKLDPLCSRRVLKSWGWLRYITSQSRQSLLAVDLSCYTSTIFTCMCLIRTSIIWK